MFKTGKLFSWRIVLELMLRLPVLTQPKAQSFFLKISASMLKKKEKVLMLLEIRYVGILKTMMPFL